MPRGVGEMNWHAVRLERRRLRTSSKLGRQENKGLRVLHKNHHIYGRHSSSFGGWVKSGVERGRPLFKSESARVARRRCDENSSDYDIQESLSVQQIWTFIFQRNV